MRWAGYVARMGDRRGAYSVLGGGDLTERGHWEDLGVDDRTILTCVLRKSVGRVCRRLVWQRIGGRDGNFVIAMMKFRVTYS